MITRSLFLLVVGLVSTLVAPVEVEAQCLPQDDDSAGLLAYAEKLAVSTDPRIVESREAYGLLAVPITEVEVISDSQTCKTAAREYKKEAGRSGKAAPVHVVRIGTRYIVVNPDERGDAGSEWVFYVVFDESFVTLAKFVS